MRYVIDTSILVAAMRSKNGASAILLQWVQEERIHAFASTPLVLEYESVLLRDTQTRVAGRSREKNLAFLKDFLRFVHPVTIFYTYRPLLTDPKDDHVLEAAINARVDLVTHNIRDFELIAPRHGVRVLRPGSIIASGGKP